jgi:hypothetical protein
MAFQSLTAQNTAEFAEQDTPTEGAPLPEVMPPWKTCPTPPWSRTSVAEKPQKSAAALMAERETVIPVAVAPTAPVQHRVSEVLPLTEAGNWARAVQVTEPPDALGVTEAIVAAASDWAITMMMSPLTTSKDVVVFGDVVEV